MTPASPPEFRSARRAVAAVWYGLATLVIGYFMTSIAVSIFAGPRWHYRGNTIPREDRMGHLGCNDEVERLFRSLHQTAFQVQGELSDDYAIAVGRRWDHFAERWRERWRELGGRCRFEDLQDTGLGPGFDRTARAYRQLDELFHVYGSMLRNNAQHAERIAHIDEELRRARRQLERAAERAGGGRP